MKGKKNYVRNQPEMMCWINKTETDLQYVWRNQEHIIFAKVCHDQFYQRPLEDELESC